MKNIYNIKKIIIFVVISFYMITAHAQTWDYISAGSGDWSSTSTWTDGSGNTVSAVPSSSNKVWIKAGHSITNTSAGVSCGTIQIDGTFNTSNQLVTSNIYDNTSKIYITNGGILNIGANVYCNNITVDAGGTFKATVGANSGPKGVYVGDHYSTPIVHIDGTLGFSSFGSNDGLNLLIMNGCTTFTIEGSGTIGIAGLMGQDADNTTNTSDLNVYINTNMALRRDGGGGNNISSALTLQFFNKKFVNNRYLTIASGKTVSIIGNGGFHSATNWPSSASPYSYSSTASQGNCTYNIYGTLDFTCQYGNNFQLATTNYTGSTQSVTVDVKSGGKLRFGGAKASNIKMYTDNSNQSASIISEAGSSIEFYGSIAPIFTLSTNTTNTGTVPKFTPSIDNLIMNNSAGVSLPNDVTINTSLVLTQGALNVNGHNLILSSTSTGSAYIPTIGTGSIVGNVTVQRYIGSSQKWRMIGFPINGNIDLSLSTGLGSQYGSGYNAYIFNEANDDGKYSDGTNTTPNAGWTPYSSLSGTVSATQGILMLGGSPTSTLNVTGTLNTGGTVSIPLSYSSGNTSKGWNLIANPFASNINWTTIIANNTSNLDNAIYRWDPATGAYASYIPGNTPASTGNQSNVIENGGSFFIHSTGATSLTIKESDKTTTNPTASLMGISTKQRVVGLDGAGSSTAAVSTVRLTLKQDGDVYGSEAVLLWGGGVPATDLFDSKYDAYDLGRMKGADLAAVDAKGVTYSIFHGSDLKSSDIENRTVALKVSQLTEGAYTLTANIESPIANGNQLSIYDRYLNQYTLIDGSSKTYSFTVNSIPVSQASDRFSLVMNVKDETTDGTSAISLLDNPTGGNQFTLYSKGNFTRLDYQLVDNSGRVLQNGKFINVEKGSTHTIQVNNILSGIYFIKLIGDSKSVSILKAVKN